MRATFDARADPQQAAKISAAADDSLPQRTTSAPSGLDQRRRSSVVKEAKKTPSKDSTVKKASVLDTLEPELVLRVSLLVLVVYLAGYLQLALPFLTIVVAAVYMWERQSRQEEIARVKRTFSYQQHRRQTAPDGSEDMARWLEEMVRVSWPVHKKNYDNWLENQLKIWMSWIPPGQVEYIKVVEGGTDIASTEPTNLRFSNWKTRANSDEMQVDMSFDWASPSKITLKVKVSKHTPSFHLVIKILSLSGNVRLQFKFCRRMPYIGVLTFFFTKSPDIDYSIKPAGAVNVAALPGLNGYIDDLIRNSLLSYMTHPNQIVLPMEQWWYPDEFLVETAAAAAAAYAAPVSQGLVEVKLVEARGLSCSTDISAPGPICRVFVSDLEDGVARRPSKTKMKMTGTGVWSEDEGKWDYGNQTVELMVMDYETNWVTIEVLICKGKKEIIIGSCKIQVGHLSKEALPHPQHQELEQDGNGEQGHLHCILVYRQKEEARRMTCPIDISAVLEDAMSLPSPPLSGESYENQGILELQLLETELDKAAMDKLTSFTDMSSKMYCLIEVIRPEPSEYGCDQVTGRHKTSDLSDPGLNPQWNQTFEFPVLGNEEIKILLFKRKKVGKDYKLDEWSLSLEDHLPSLQDNLMHEYNMESEESFNPKEWSPNKVRFSVRFVSMRKFATSPKSGSNSEGAFSL